ncbi:MAG: flagellar protein FlgN [Firmicutes bacterium]|jgi:flagellar biosynthesis/type III secretory pathway chaperone|nr:flagellar protein FlgN [Bacillota bacterium]
MQQQLTGILQKECSLLGELKQSLLAERQALLERNAEQLHTLCNRKTELEKSLQQLEAERLLLTGQRSLKELAQDLEQAELLELGEKLKTLLRENRKLQQANLLLIKCELAVWEHVQNVLSPKAKSYTATGSLEKGNTEHGLIAHRA